MRLVFNGHVLQPDAKTVAACGLYDNCVVHCLIHNPRPSVVPETSQMNNNQQHPLANDGKSLINRLFLHVKCQNLNKCRFSRASWTTWYK